jgi:hypothetical protein
LLGKSERIALAGVDGNRDRLGEAAPARDPAAGVRCARGLLRLPEDRFPPLHLRENKLRARLPRAVEDEIDRRSPAPAQQHRRLLDDLGIRWP